MWFVIWLVGVAAGMLALRTYELARSGQLKYKWYHWAIATVWYGLGFFVVAFVGTSLSLGETRAAGMATLIFGGVVVIVGLLLYRFLFSGVKVRGAERSTAA